MVCEGVKRDGSGMTPNPDATHTCIDSDYAQPAHESPQRRLADKARAGDVQHRIWGSRHWQAGGRRYEGGIPRGQGPGVCCLRRARRDGSSSRSSGRRRRLHSDVGHCATRRSDELIPREAQEDVQ